MAKQLKYTVLVPVEIKLDNPLQIGDAIKSIRRQGKYPFAEHYGDQCYSWRTRHDLAQLKNVKPVCR